MDEHDAVADVASDHDSGLSCDWAELDLDQLASTPPKLRSLFTVDGQLWSNPDLPVLLVGDKALRGWVDAGRTETRRRSA